MTDNNGNTKGVEMTIRGNAVKFSSVRETQYGPVSDMLVAVSKKVNDVETTDWYTVECWKHLSVVVEQVEAAKLALAQTGINTLRVMVNGSFKVKESKKEGGTISMKNVISAYDVAIIVRPGMLLPYEGSQPKEDDYAEEADSEENGYAPRAYKKDEDIPF